MSQPVRPLRAVPTPSIPAGASAAEAEAIAEVARARSTLPTIDPAAFDCYLGGIVQRMEPTSEADPVNILGSLISACGVHLGPGPHLRAGDDPHPLLVWPLIVGKTGGGRKGAGWNSARRVLTAADPDFMTINRRSGLTSGEGLAAMFTDDDHNPTSQQPTEGDEGTAVIPPRAPGQLPAGDHRLLIYEAEWAAVMARMKREGNSLSATLRAAWEGGDLSTLAVNARIAKNTHIGIVAHITPKEFRDKVSASDLAGGTYNRFLPLAVARSKFLPYGGGVDADTLDQLAVSLRDRLTAGSQLGTIGFTDSGAELWRELYVEFGSEHGEHSAVEEFISRAAPNCLRIAGIHAALDFLDTIKPEHLRAAAALVRYSIATARAVFTDTQTPARLLAWITEGREDGRTRKDITTRFFAGNRRADDITAMLDQLIHAGRITRTTRKPDGGRGRPTEIYTARTQPRERNELTNKPSDQHKHAAT